MTRGSKFRRRVSAELAVDQADPVWAALLSEVERQMDVVERLEAELAESPLVVEGSTGQRRVNTLLPELRQQRLALARLLQALGTEEGETQSQRQSRIAQRRWRR